MVDNVVEQYGLPINLEGEVVARLGTGSRDIAGVLPRDFNPVNLNGELVVNLAPAGSGESFVTAKTNPLTGGLAFRLVINSLLSCRWRLPLCLPMRAV